MPAVRPVRPVERAAWTVCRCQEVIIAAGEKASITRTSKSVLAEVDIHGRLCVVFSSLDERKSVVREMTNCP